MHSQEWLMQIHSAHSRRPPAFEPRGLCMMMIDAQTDGLVIDAGYVDVVVVVAAVVADDG